MQDKHASTQGIMFPRTLTLRGHDYRRSGPNQRNGLYNYEASQGEPLAVAQVEIKYVAERGPALGNVVDNEAMTDILIKKSSIGSLAIDGLPPNACDRLKVGDIWLVCDIEEDSDDPEAFPAAAGACRLRNGNTDDPGAVRAPRSSPAPGGATSKGEVRPQVARERRYEGRIGRLHPGGYGFIHETNPKVFRDPYIEREEVRRLKGAGVQEGDPVTFKLWPRSDEDEKGPKLTAYDIQPL